MHHDDISGDRPARLIRRAEVEKLTSLSRSTIYLWMSEDRFPKPVLLGARNVAWRLSDVLAWIAGRSADHV